MNDADISTVGLNVSIENTKFEEITIIKNEENYCKIEVKIF